MSMITTIKNNLVNIPGWRTRRKIVVFESDDWGMVRMTSKKAYYRLKRKGYPIGQSIYNKYDRIESDEDILGLMEVLNSVKDKRNKPAKFTLNNIVANPDFPKIKEDRYENYTYEPFTKSLERYSDSSNVMRLYQEGIQNQLFQPQFHGREHLQVNNWLKKLQNQEAAFIDAFEEGMYTINAEENNTCLKECLDGMSTYSDTDFSLVTKSISEGICLFKKIWGFTSCSVIAPCYTWHSNIEPCFKENGISYIQGARAQREPLPNYQKRIKRHFQGQKSPSGLIYLIRNVHFEQAQNENIDWVDSAMNEIKTAFRWNKPAIVSSHRVNYIGTLDPENRSRNLRLLGNLLKNIVKNYPEVEFMSSDELGNLITGKEVCAE